MTLVTLSWYWCLQWPCTRHEVVCHESWLCVAQRHTGGHHQYKSFSVRGSSHSRLTLLFNVWFVQHLYVVLH